MARGFSFKPVGLSDFNQLTATRQAFERDRTQSIKNAFNDISLGLINRDIKKKYTDPTSIEALTELSQRTAQIDPVVSQRYGTLVNSAISSEQAKREKEFRDSLFGGGGATGTSQTATPQGMGVTVQTYGEDGQPTGQAETGVIKSRNLLEESKKEYFSGMGIGADGLNDDQRLAVQRIGAIDVKDALKKQADFVSENTQAFRENNNIYVKQAAAWNKANPPGEVRKYNATLNQLGKTQTALSDIVKAKEFSGSSFTNFMLSTSGIGARVSGILPKDARSAFIESVYPENPELAKQVVQIPDQIATVVQDSLRQILGAAYTQVEGENVLARAFDPTDSDANNLVKVTRLLQRMKAYGEGRMELSAHLQKPGATIQNFQPSDSSINIETLTTGVNENTGKRELSVGQRADFYNTVLGESGLINAETGEGGLNEAQLQEILDSEDDGIISTINKAAEYIGVK